jgi:hypothetical protein
MSTGIVVAEAGISAAGKRNLNMTASAVEHMPIIATAMHALSLPAGAGIDQIRGETMTPGPHRSFNFWKREKMPMAALVCPVRFPSSRQRSPVMHALAMLGLGLEGVACGEDEPL